jgi:hypothetical protein
VWRSSSTWPDQLPLQRRSSKQATTTWATTRAAARRGLRDGFDPAGAALGDTLRPDAEAKGTELRPSNDVASASGHWSASVLLLAERVSRRIEVVSVVDPNLHMHDDVAVSCDGDAELTTALLLRHQREHASAPGAECRRGQKPLASAAARDCCPRRSGKLRRGAEPFAADSRVLGTEHKSGDGPDSSGHRPEGSPGQRLSRLLSRRESRRGVSPHGMSRVAGVLRPRLPAFWW